MVIRSTHSGVQKRPFFFFPSLTELRLSCLDPSCDALSGHKMNSQVWLNKKELQSVAVLHPSVLGSDIKRFTAATFLWRKKAGFCLLHNTWAKFPEIKAPMQWWESEKTQQHSVLLWQNKHWASFTQSLSFDYHTGNHGARCKLSSCWTIKWNQQIVFLRLSQNKEKKNNQNTFTVFDLLTLHCCFSVIVWVWWSKLLHHMVSCWLGHAAQEAPVCGISHASHVSFWRW